MAALVIAYAQDRHRVALYCGYWISNHTDLPLALAPAKTKAVLCCTVPPNTSAFLASLPNDVYVRLGADAHFCEAALPLRQPGVTSLVECETGAVFGTLAALRVRNAGGRVGTRTRLLKFMPYGMLLNQVGHGCM